MELENELVNLIPRGTIPLVSVKYIKERKENCFDIKKDDFLLRLLDGRNELKQLGYYDNITLTINNKRFNELDIIKQYRLKNEEFFKLNIERETETCMYGFYKYKDELMRIMILLMEE